MWMLNPKIGGKPPKWMVKIMENPIKMDDLGGFPIIFGNTHVGIYLKKNFLSITSSGRFDNPPCVSTCFERRCLLCCMDFYLAIACYASIFFG